MLKKAVDSLRSGDTVAMSDEDIRRSEAELRVAALIPDDYLPDVHLRLILYKRIANAADAEELRELQVEMIDRFGLLPEQVKSLFRLTRIKLQAAKLGIRRVEASAKSGSLWFYSKTPLEPLTLIDLIQKSPARYRLDGQDRLKFTAEMLDDEMRFRVVESLLSELLDSI